MIAKLNMKYILIVIVVKINFVFLNFVFLMTNAYVNSASQILKVFEKMA